MRIITHTCPECATIVAANVLEDDRITKCPGLGCEAVIRFEDLPEEERRHFLDNRDRYRI